MMLRSVCLTGGPPWGLRFATTNDGSIIVAQVLPNGRADREGIKIGDILESINGEACASMNIRMVQSKMHSKQGMLKLGIQRHSLQRSIDRFGGSGHHLPPSPRKYQRPSPVHFTNATFVEMQQPECETKQLHAISSPLSPLTIKTSPESSDYQQQQQQSKPKLSEKFNESISNNHPSSHYVHISLPPKAAKYMAVDGYTGGHRGSTDDKRRFFEMIATQQQQPHQQQAETDRLLHQKIQMGGSLALPSDQTTVISGYDSVGGDFAALANRSTEASKHSPTSCDLTEDEWAQDRLNGLYSPLGQPGETLMDIENNRYTPTYRQLDKNQATREHELENHNNNNNNNRLIYRCVTPLASEQNAVLHNKPTSMTLDALMAQVSKLNSNGQSSQEVFSEQSQPKELRDEIGDAPSTTTSQETAKMALSVPPPPPPMPNSNPVFNGNWRIKSESQNTGIAQSSIEIPERQSVASLREQLANKLEVKAPNGTKAIVHSARERQQRPCVTPVSFDRIPKSLDFGRLNSTGDTTAQLNGNSPLYMSQNGRISVQGSRIPVADSAPSSEYVKPIVHEPAQRHLSCITPLPFSKSLLHQSATSQELSPVIYTPASEQSFTSDYHSNYEGTPLHETSNNGIFHLGHTESNYAKSSLPNEHELSMNESNLGNSKEAHTDSAIDLTMPSPLSTKQASLNGDQSEKLSNECAKVDDYSDIASPSSVLSIGSSSTHPHPQPEMPAFSTPYYRESERSTKQQHEESSSKVTSADERQSKTSPASRRNDQQLNDGLFSSSAREDVAVPSLSTSQYALDSKLMQYSDDNTSSQNKQFETSTVMNHTSPQRHYHQKQYHQVPSAKDVNQLSEQLKQSSSDNSYWYKKMFQRMHKIESQQDQSILKYRTARDLTSPVPSHHTSRAWTPTATLESRFDYECLPPRRCKSVGRYVDSGHRDSPSEDTEKDIVERWRRERAQLSARTTQAESTAARSPSLHLTSSSLATQQHQSNSPSRPASRAANASSHTNENGSLGRDLYELKKSAKEELLNRQRVEKLSEELEEQRNRRHGYVPSASPALQKNFDRFDGLLNEFGQSDHRRATTPSFATTPHQVIATCTALYSFKAQSARELSFNRGDVIRVHRVVDANWLEGERNGQVGIFPSSYVQMDEGVATERMKMIALYPFFGRNRNELSLKKGEVVEYRRTIDANWMEGVNCHGEIGIFPKTYVQEFSESDLRIAPTSNVDECIPDRPKTPKIITSSHRDESQLPTRKMNHGNEVQAWQQKHTKEGLSGAAHIVPRNAETYRALYAYKPRNVDELELCENDIVFVVEKCDDGWYIGTLLRTGQFGTFPGNYVEKH